MKNILILLILLFSFYKGLSQEVVFSYVEIDSDTLIRVGNRKYNLYKGEVYKTFNTKDNKYILFGQTFLPLPINSYKKIRNYIKRYQCIFEKSKDNSLVRITCNIPGYQKIASININGEKICSDFTTSSQKGSFLLTLIGKDSTKFSGSGVFQFTISLKGSTNKLLVVPTTIMFYKDIIAMTEEPDSLFFQNLKENLPYKNLFYLSVLITIILFLIAIGLIFKIYKKEIKYSFKKFIKSLNPFGKDDSSVTPDDREQNQQPKTDSHETSNENETTDSLGSKDEAFNNQHDSKIEALTKNVNSLTQMLIEEFQRQREYFNVIIQSNSSNVVLKQELDHIKVLLENIKSNNPDTNLHFIKVGKPIKAFAVDFLDFHKYVEDKIIDIIENLSKQVKEKIENIDGTNVEEKLKMEHIYDMIIEIKKKYHYNNRQFELDKYVEICHLISQTGYVSKSLYDNHLGENPNDVMAFRKKMYNLDIYISNILIMLEELYHLDIFTNQKDFLYFKVIKDTIEPHNREFRKKVKEKLGLTIRYIPFFEKLEDVKHRIVFDDNTAVPSSIYKNLKFEEKTILEIRKYGFEESESYGYSYKAIVLT